MEVRLFCVSEGEEERRRPNMDERLGGGASTTGSLRPKSGMLIAGDWLSVLMGELCMREFKVVLGFV